MTWKMIQAIQLKKKKKKVIINDIQQGLHENNLSKIGLLNSQTGLIRKVCWNSKYP